MVIHLDIVCLTNVTLMNFFLAIKNFWKKHTRSHISDMKRTKSLITGVNL